jgi:hypothetical protein
MAEIIDFDSSREAVQHKRKEAKAEALKRAFRLARGEKTESRAERRRKRRKTPKK